MNDQGLTHSFTIDWYMDVADSSRIAVCHDCLCLIYFLRTMRSLFYDGEETLECTERSEADGYALVGHLRYILRRLSSPLVVNGMMRSLTEFKGPGCGQILSETMYADGRRRMCTCITPPVICSAGRSSHPLIGRRGLWGQFGRTH